MASPSWKTDILNAVLAGHQGEVESVKVIKDELQKVQAHEPQSARCVVKKPIFCCGLSGPFKM